MTLKPTNRQKSFYGKANVIETETAYLLKSYETVVCSIDKATGAFTRLWSDYSATTMRHINSFRETYGLHTINKAEWLSL